MNFHNTLKLTTLLTLSSVALANSAFAGGKKWEPALDAKEDHEKLSIRCMRGLEKTSPNTAPQGESEEDRIKLAKILSKRDVWATRMKKLAQLSKDVPLSTKDYEYLCDSTPLELSFSQSIVSNNNDDVSEGKQEEGTALLTVKKTPEELWNEEVTSTQKAKWFNLVMEAVEKEQPPSITEERIEKRKDPNKKAWRAFGAAFLGAVSGSSEDALAWPEAVKLAKKIFHNYAITEIPLANTWVSKYGFPSHWGLIHIKNYYPSVKLKIDENISKVKEEFLKNMES